MHSTKPMTSGAEPILTLGEKIKKNGRVPIEDYIYQILNVKNLLALYVQTRIFV
jgi:hypothetical protein